MDTPLKRRLEARRTEPERPIPEWLRRAKESRLGLAKDLTKGATS